MGTRRESGITNRRGFLVNGMSLAGAAALTSATADPSGAAPSGAPVRLAQAGARASAAPTSSALTVKAVERLAGSTTSFAYAVKAGPWIFLNGHEAFDFERGLAPEVEGPPGNRLSGRPPLRREADYILRRMRSILKEFGSDLPNAVRVDQYYTMGPAVSAYHLARFAEFGELHPAQHLDHHGALLHGAHQYRTPRMIAIVPAPGWTHREDHAAGPGDLGLRLQSRRSRPTTSCSSPATWRRATTASSIRTWRAADPQLGRPDRRSAARCTTASRSGSSPRSKAAGSALEHCVKAQAYIRGVENFPDFMDVWSQHFRDIPCAITLVPAKDYASTEGMIEINLIALKNGATRQEAGGAARRPGGGDLRALRARGRTGVSVGLLARRARRAGAGGRPGGAFDALGLAGQAQGALLLSYADAVCRAVGVTHGERGAGAIFPDRHARLRRRLGRLVGSLRQRAASVCGVQVPARCRRPVPR